MAAEPPVDVTTSEGADPARRRGGGGAAQQRPQHLQLHQAHARTSPSCRAPTATRSASAARRASTTTSRWTAPTSTTRSSASSAAASGRRSPSTSTRCRTSWWWPTAPTPSSAARSGGFVNVITKSGTNEFHGSAHYFGKYDALSADFSHTFPSGGTTGFSPDFTQHQFGATLGGPLVRDKAFFFLAYDQQEYNETKQTDRLSRDRAGAGGVHRHRVRRRAGGRLRPDQPHQRRQRLAGQARLPAEPEAQRDRSSTTTPGPSQQNGTFDVDSWGRSANALEKDYSHAVNGSLTSLFSSALSNEFRFQCAREDRPRPYDGPDQPGQAGRSRHRLRLRPDGYRSAMPFFIPVRLRTTTGSRSGQRLARPGQPPVQGRRASGTGPASTRPSSASPTAAWLQLGERVPQLRGQRQPATSSAPTARAARPAPARPATTITGPVALYLQQAGVGGLTVEEAGTQTIIQHELALFLQDSWKPQPNLTRELRPALGGADRAQPDHADRPSSSTRRSSARRSPTRRARSSSPATARSRRTTRCSSRGSASRRT